VLDDLAARRMVYYPFGGFFPNESEDRPSTAADATLLIRYYLARFGPYWNIILNVAGFEAEAFLSDATIRGHGSQIASLDPFGHLLGVHQLNGDDAFRHDGWNSLTTLQHEITDLAALGTYLRRHHDANQPVFAQETVWMGNTLQPAWTLTDLRKQMWVHLMSATTLCVGDMAGNNISGFSGSLRLADRIQERHDVPRRIWDFMEKIPFQRMSPAQSVVSTGFALAEPGQRYLVYLPSGGSVDVAVTTGTYSVTWVNATDPTRMVSSGSTSTGQDLGAPDGHDWVLHLERTSSVPPPPAGEADLISAATFAGHSSGWSTVRGVTRAHDDSTATEAWADTTAEVWLEYAFNAPHTLTRARVYDDNAGNHQIGRWRMQYLVGAAWTDAFAAKESGTIGWSEAVLDGITATRVRVLCQAPAGVFLELREFECYGVPAGDPVPGGVPLIFEAEDAARAGVTVASNHTGFTGRGFGDYDGSAGSSITWTVNLSAAGIYLLDLRYANGGSANRALALTVNGTSVDPGWAMPVTGGWTTWSYSADQEVILPVGTSTIRASAVTVGPNLDHLRLTPAPSGGG
jgi:hypothetical protein